MQYMKIYQFKFFVCILKGADKSYVKKVHAISTDSREKKTWILNTFRICEKRNSPSSFFAFLSTQTITPPQRGKEILLISHGYLIKSPNRSHWKFPGIVPNPLHCEIVNEFESHWRYCVHFCTYIFENGTNPLIFPGYVVQLMFF